MGERTVMQVALFYCFRLEQYLSVDHLLRSIGRFIDLSGIREHLRPYYSETGRPLIDPELLMTTVARCMAGGPVGGDGFAVDASMIKADANRQRSVPGSDGPSVEAAGHAVREYLEVLDDAAFGAATQVMPKFISVADPASRWTGANGALVFFACCTNYLIDLKHAMIVDVEATTAVRQVEVTAQRIMLDRTQKRFGLWPERLAADSGYGDATNLAWLVHARHRAAHTGIREEPHLSQLGRDDFIFDHRTGSYTCPGGKQLWQYWQPVERQRPARPPTDSTGAGPASRTVKNAS